MQHLCHFKFFVDLEAEGAVFEPLDSTLGDAPETWVIENVKPVRNHDVVEQWVDVLFPVVVVWDLSCVNVGADHILTNGELVPVGFLACYKE